MEQSHLILIDVDCAMDSFTSVPDLFAPLPVPEDNRHRDRFADRDRWEREREREEHHDDDDDRAALRRLGNAYALHRRECVPGRGDALQPFRYLSAFPLPRGLALCPSFSTPYWTAKDHIVLVLVPQSLQEGESDAAEEDMVSSTRVVSALSLTRSLARSLVLPFFLSLFSCSPLSSLYFFFFSDN